MNSSLLSPIETIYDGGNGQSTSLSLNEHVFGNAILTSASNLIYQLHSLPNILACNKVRRYCVLALIVELEQNGFSVDAYDLQIVLQDSYRSRPLAT